VDPLCIEKMALAYLFLAPETQRSTAFTYPSVVHFGLRNGLSVEPWDKERLLRENYITATAFISRDVYLQSGVCLFFSLFPKFLGFVSKR
jgi:hypothetical protein